MGKDFIMGNIFVKENGGGRSLGKLGQPLGHDRSLNLNEGERGEAG